MSEKVKTPNRRDLASVKSLQDTLERKLQAYEVAKTIVKNCPDTKEEFQKVIKSGHLGDIYAFAIKTINNKWLFPSIYYQFGELEKDEALENYECNIPVSSYGYWINYSSDNEQYIDLNNWLPAEQWMFMIFEREGCVGDASDEAWLSELSKEHKKLFEYFESVINMDNKSDFLGYVEKLTRINAKKYSDFNFFLEQIMQSTGYTWLDVCQDELYCGGIELPRWSDLQSLIDGFRELKPKIKRHIKYQQWLKTHMDEFLEFLRCLVVNFEKQQKQEAKKCK